MNKKILTCLLCLVPFAANADMIYTAEQKKPLAEDHESVADNQKFATHRRFYAGAMYNFTMWNNGEDESYIALGKNKSSFELMLGVRVYDTFRIEANYYQAEAGWDEFDLSGSTVFVNAIFDARIDSKYRLFRKQTLVPYVGLGIGASWNTVDSSKINIEIDNRTSAVVAGLVGIAIEMGDRFAVDLGYRYMYMFEPKFNVISDFAPTAHQFRAGMRVNF